LAGFALAGLLVGAAALGTAGLPTIPSPADAITEPAAAAGPDSGTAFSPSVAPPGDALGSGKAVTLAFGGDVHFEGVLARRLAAHPRTFLDPARALYSGADLVMVNLESAITTGGSPEPKQFTFRAPPSAYGALKAAGITVATQANNHGEDYGAVGLADSINAARHAGFPVIGVGFNVTEAFAPYRTTIDGQRIAIIAATQVLDDNLRAEWTATDTHSGLASAYDTDHLLAAVREVRRTADTVVIYVHWGTEQQNCPNGLQPPLARQLVDAGADIVVGSHAHVQLGAGRLGRALVDYGLGNFAFYATSGAQVESGVLKVTVTGRRIDSYQWTPARISDGIPHPLHGSAATTAVTRWASQRSCTDLSA
jgi:poly-gamma-glutamate synthesis protein (capsule biosynthesis protein)